MSQKSMCLFNFPWECLHGQNSILASAFGNYHAGKLSSFYEEGERKGRYHCLGHCVIIIMYQVNNLPIAIHFVLKSDVQWNFAQVIECRWSLHIGSVKLELFLGLLFHAVMDGKWELSVGSLIQDASTGRKGGHTCFFSLFYLA